MAIEQEVTDKALSAAKGAVTNKRSRSVIFVVISFIIILAINAMLPIIEGQTHYTVNAIEYTYAEYVVLSERNDNHALTWASEQKIKKYIEDYVEANSELTEEEKVTVEPPNELKVLVYTDYFFEYPFWYMSTVTALASAVLIFYSLFNFLIVRSKDRYKKYVDLEEALDDLTDKQLDPDTFEPWTENVFNFRRKKKQHLSNVKFALDVLEQKTKYKHKKKFKRYFASKDAAERQRLYSYYEPYTKKEMQYFNSKDELLSLLDEDYIKSHVLHGNVKYFRYIHSMFVYNGTNIAGNLVDSYSGIKSDGKRLRDDSIAKIVLSLAITLVFSTLFTLTVVASIDQDPLWIWVNIISKLAPLLIQIPLAFNYSDSFMHKHLIPNLLSRRSIALQYLADLKNKVKLEDEPVYVPQVLEVTEEPVLPPSLRKGVMQGA